MSDTIMFCFWCIAIWCFIGFGIFRTYEDNSTKYSSYHDSPFAYLNPVWIYENYNVNFFGAFILMLLFNLTCPVVTIIYWFCKFIKFICTVGKKSK